MRGFTVREGVAVAELDDEERTVVARIVADVGLLLGGEQFGMDAPVDRDAGATPAEQLLANLTLLDESHTAPDDPAVLRVLPSASRDDRAVADEFRRLTESDLRDLKVARLHAMWEQLSEDGPEWEVAPEEWMATASALTDVRLVLATRLRIETDEDSQRLHSEIELAVHAQETDAQADLGIDPERVWLGMLYDALGWLQESLMSCVMQEADNV